VLASHSPQIARRASLLAGSLYLTVGLIPVAVGLLGTHLMPGLEESEQILPAVAQKYLSTGLYIVFVGAIVSAILSTVSGALLAAGALTAHNLVVPLKPHISAAGRVRAARIAIVGAGIVAFVLARHAEGVYQLVEEASAFGSAGVFIAATFGLFSRFGGPRAAYAALIAGTVVWISGHYMLQLATPYLLALVTALFAYLSVGLLEQSRPLTVAT
jgi:Na+/proline symporter